MKCHLIALWAELIDFHLVWMVSLVPCGDIVFLATLSAFKYNLIAFTGHISIFTLLARLEVYHKMKVKSIIDL